MWENRGTMGPFRPFYIYSRFPNVGFANIPDLIFFEFLRAANQGKIGKKDLIWGAPYKNISKFHEHKY